MRELECRRSFLSILLLALALLLTAGASFAQEREGARNFDARLSGKADLSKAQPLAPRKAAEDDLRRTVPDLAVDYDPMTGVARNVRSHSGYLTGPAQGSAMAIAQRFAAGQLELLGLTRSDLAHFRVRDMVESPVTGATHIYMEQTHRGIPVYNGQLHININRDGRVLSVNNAFMPNLEGTVNMTRPSLRPAEVLVAVADHLGLTLSEEPREIGAQGGEQEATTLAGSGISRSHIEAQLYWLPVNARETRLMWNLQIETFDGQHWYDINVDAETARVWTRFDWTNSGTYRVFDRTDESPLHGSQTRALVVDPEDPTFSPNGWFTGGTMSGNNVTACPDTDGNNSCDSNPQCSGTTCDFPLNLANAPSTFIPAATANLFYWNNLIHDIQAVYGFTEVAGNFQETNFSGQGAGGDSVNADAQDGSGNCNANFSTPTDGGNPRMQMFTCTNATPARDGDFDNGVIAHEYGHGISIRQVGGPGNSSCLNNTQQAGEGWSDYWGLTYTIEAGDAGTDVRGIGSYLFALAPEGGTIRDLPYSTDDAVNNWTYESISGAGVPHGVGSRWAQVAWEVTWMLIDKHGLELDLENLDISDPNEAGNKRAMFYVNEGFKNTACSPTFVDNRDGIIQVVTDNFGGEDLCDVWQVFADFGLGTDAVSGGSGSTNPTNGFQIPAACQCSPQPIAAAGPDQTICLGDSTTVGTPAQPDNTYSWAPGGETTAQITVSPTVDTTYTVTATTAACGSANDSATIFVDDGTDPAGLSDDFEGDNSDWTTTGLWHEVTNTACVSPSSTSGTNAFYYGQDAGCTYDTGAANSGSLTSPTIFGVTASSTLEFQYWRVVESFSGDFDQTDVEIVTATGATNVFALNSSNASTAAWVSSGSIDLSAFAGQQIQVRFTFNTGDGVANNFTGWLIDDVVVTGTSNCAPPPGCTSDAECDNGDFCDGAETCNLGTGVCEAGTAPNCDDGVSCTVDSCNETTDSCDNSPNDSLCTDGLFCNGTETCDAVNDCQAGTAPNCDDGVSCTVDACNESTDSCDNTASDALCDDGLFCNGSETCDAVNDCQAGTDPCGGGACDEAGDFCPECVVDADCDDGLFCNGAETCNAGACQAGTDPCGAGETCNETGDVCEPGGGPGIEWGTVSVDGAVTTVLLANTYTSAVVVTTVNYVNNTAPVVTRVSNVTSTSFDVRLQNPSGSAVAADTVSYLVVEEGAHTIGGVNIEAQTFTSTVTDENNSWVGQAQSYLQSYTNPVVLGQVMSENDLNWSVFWEQGGTRQSPPSATALTVGKTVAEDTLTTRADETLGLVVIEAGNGNLGGVAFEAALGADTVRGPTNSPPYTYTFGAAFSAAPAVRLATMAGVDGGNGGWAYTTGATASTLDLLIDEDQIGDNERNHTTEQVSYLVFATSGSSN